MIKQPICEKCQLYKYSDNPVINGRGSANPNLILIGEAPGCDEAKKGEVFIGKAGRKLNQMLKNYQDLNIYITNAVKCFPPLSVLNPKKGFRVPKLTEIDFCKTLLISELSTITEHLQKSTTSTKATEFTTPVLMPLGNTALYALTGKQGGITSSLGIITQVQLGNYTYSIIPNYHPSYICRNPKMEVKFIETMNICRDFMEKRNVNNGTTGSS